jgi:hypothetical protein
MGRRQEVGCQLELLDGGEYIDIRITKDATRITYEEALIVRMKIAGHDYLDSVRNPEVWKKTKKTLEKVGGSAALEVVKGIASRIMTEVLNHYIGP